MMMKKNNVMSFVKGAGIGIMMGSVAGAAGYGYMHTHKKGMKKNVSKALRNMGDLVDNVTGMF